MGFMVAESKIRGYDFIDFGIATNIAGGIRYNNFRADLSIYDRSGVSEVVQILLGNYVTIYNSSLMINGYYDVLSSKYFDMFLGVGIGPNKYSYDITDNGRKFSEKGYSISSSAVGGISINTNFGLSFDATFEYNYITKVKMESYVTKLGLRYTF